MKHTLIPRECPACGGDVHKAACVDCGNLFGVKTKPKKLLDKERLKFEEIERLRRHDPSLRNSCKK